MKIFREPGKLQKWCRTQKLAGRKIALVPTMGYLHEGHLSLIAEAKRRKADEIVVSVFVNPVQFGPNEDYAKYPRDEKADLAKCRKAGATAVFFPTPENMYLDRHSVYINEEDLSKGLCGARRPGHFRGVCTVVAKLFNLAHPDFAVFGQIPADIPNPVGLKMLSTLLGYDFVGHFADVTPHCNTIYHNRLIIHVGGKKLYLVEDGHRVGDVLYFAMTNVREA